MECVKIYGIMVIYNKCLKDSAAYQCLRHQEILLTVCDNSTKDYGNAQIAQADGIHYISMEDNLGLSKAYNRALNDLFARYQPEKKDYVCLFDDDTVIEKAYLEAVRNSKAEILLPFVYDGMGMMSPVYMPGRVAARFSSEKEALEAEAGKISGINSGMAVHAEIFEKYRYNEEMFLDYIDHMFIMDMREKGIYPEILDIRMEQNFSAVNDSKEAAVKRFRMQKHDLKIFYRKRPLLYFVVVFKKHLKLTLKYKDVKMMFN